MTLAEAKRRLTVGSVFYCTQNVKGIHNPPLYRRVVIQQTNSIACATAPGAENDARPKLTWLYWPKAKDFNAIEGGFELPPINPEYPKLRYLFSI